MSIEIKLPVLGEGVDSGTVAGVLVAAGESVEADAPLIELETDKAVLEVPAGETGVVVSLPVKTGDTVTVGQVIATIETSGESVDSSTERAIEESAAELASRTIDVPHVLEPPVETTSTEPSSVVSGRLPSSDSMTTPFSE